MLAFKDSKGNWNDPLLWWKQRESIFPNLAKLARIYLAIPATSAPSECLFSKASLVINKKCSRLSPGNAAMTIFLQGNIDWFENEINDDEDDDEVQ